MISIYLFFALQINITNKYYKTDIYLTLYSVYLLRRSFTPFPTSLKTVMAHQEKLLITISRYLHHSQYHDSKNNTRRNFKSPAHIIYIIHNIMIPKTNDFKCILLEICQYFCHNNIGLHNCESHPILFFSSEIEAMMLTRLLMQRQRALHLVTPATDTGMRGWCGNECCMH